MSLFAMTLVTGFDIAYSFKCVVTGCAFRKAETGMHIVLKSNCPQLCLEFDYGSLRWRNLLA